MNTTKKLMFTGLGLAAVASPMMSTTAQAATATTIQQNITVTTPSNATRYLWSAKGTGSSVAIAPNSNLTGDEYSDGWFNVHTVDGKPATADQAWYWNPQSAPSTTTPANTVNNNATVTASNVTRYTGVDYANYPYDSRSTNATHGSAVVPLTPISGNLYSDGSFVATSGPYAGKTFFHTLPSNPYNSYETRQWQDVAGVQATAPTTATVTRYIVTNRVQAPLHTSANYGPNTISNRVASGTTLSGHYINSHWFQITSGAYAGKYVSSGIIYTGPGQSSVNGRLGGNDLCTVPSAMRENMSANSGSMGCEAVQQLIKADAGMANATGIHVEEWEAYRTLATQQQYYALYGSPQAAIPGTSNHGLGVAMDLNYGGTLTWGSTQVQDMSTYGPAYGWVKPTYLLPSNGWNGEPWHYEFNG